MEFSEPGPDLPPEEQVELLMAGCEYGDGDFEAAMRAQLLDRLRQCRAEGRALRVYTGYDPTGPDLHLGHAITLGRLRLFQQLGHQAIVVIGTFTALVGDTSDRASGRPPADPEVVRAAAASYAEQCFMILDRHRTEVHYNDAWLSELKLTDVLALAGSFTVQQFLARDNFRRRLADGDPIGLAEFFYALLQGHDAVVLRADVQLGATEQLFNLRAGAKLQEAAGQKPCVALTFPILVGTDGAQRMSKSTGNYIGIAEDPDTQFGKVMSISDETMLAWAPLVTSWPPAQVREFVEAVGRGDQHPMEAKKLLAGTVVATYHGTDAADRARAGFEAVHQRGQLPQDMEEFAFDPTAAVVAVMVEAGLAPSRSAARRLVQQGAVSLDGRVLSDVDAPVAEGVLRVGRRRFLRLRPAR